jgi:hypothetical protein
MSWKNGLSYTFARKAMNGDSIMAKIFGMAIAKIAIGIQDLGESGIVDCTQKDMFMRLTN